MSVFPLGETLTQPTIPALVNDLAPDHLRARYNALSSAAFSLAAIIGPVTAGWLIGHSLGPAFHRAARARLRRGDAGERRPRASAPPGVNDISLNEVQEALTG